MNKALLVILLFLVWQCRAPQSNSKSDIFYIYDSNGLFQSYRNCNDSMDYLAYRISVPTSKYVDTFLVAKNYNYYELFHYYKYNNYQDTSFVLPKSYLDGIKFHHADSFRSKEKLDSMWMPVDCWRCGGIYDSKKIYMVLPLEKTDSLVFLRVHRWFHQTQ